MKTVGISRAALLVVVLALTAGCHLLGHNEEAMSLYVCDCGADCCKVAESEPGTCDCSKPLKKVHVIEQNGDQASVCACDADCGCGVNAEDPTKCGCGTPLKTINLKS